MGFIFVQILQFSPLAGTLLIKALSLMMGFRASKTHILKITNKIKMTKCIVMCSELNINLESKNLKLFKIKRWDDDNLYCKNENITVVEYIIY